VHFLRLLSFKLGVGHTLELTIDISSKHSWVTKHTLEEPMEPELTFIPQQIALQHLLVFAELIIQVKDFAHHRNM